MAGPDDSQDNTHSDRPDRPTTGSADAASADARSTSAASTGATAADSAPSDSTLLDGYYVRRIFWALVGIAVLSLGSAVLRVGQVGVDPYTAANIGDVESGDATVGGSLLGMLIGVLGGPLGVLLGFGLGAAGGALVDASRSDDIDDAITEFGKTVRKAEKKEKRDERVQKLKAKFS